MFRPLSRKEKELSREECIALLKSQKRGVLCVNGEGGYPYGMPMNPWYDERTGKLYFHCGTEGHRVDALRADDRVCFCTNDEGELSDDGWSKTVKSVIAFGRVAFVRDRERIGEVTAALSRKFTSDEEYIRKEIDAFAHRTLLLEMTVEHLCGKRVRES